MHQNITKTQRTVGVAIFAAIIVVLQVFSTAMNAVTPGMIPIALVLPPIVIGAAMYGVRAGMFLGFCFSLVVLGSGIFSIAPTSAVMWYTNPFIMTAGTLGRGIAIGFTAGILYKFISKWDSALGVLAAAVIMPIVNTGIFIVMLLFFREALFNAGIFTEERAGWSFIEHAALIMVAFNFMFELVVNVVLSSTITRIIYIAKKRGT
jgi:uncharacterized membrane protein